MAQGLLIHADSVRDADLFVATSISVVDPFSYIEADGRRIIVTSVLEADAARRNSTADEVWTPEEFGIRELVRGGMDRHVAELELTRRVLEKLSLDEVAVPVGFPLALADYLREHGVRVVPDRQRFEARRRRKDERALAGIRRAQRATEAAFERVRAMLAGSTPGADGLVNEGEPLTCERVRAAIEETLRAHGCEGEPPIVSSGPQGAFVHELGSGPIRAGESLIVDVFPRDTQSRFCADMTRTFCYGEAPDRLRNMHGVVLVALRKSTEAMRPGASGTSVWEVACDVIEAGGYRTQRQAQAGETLDEDFFHGLGHGVGFDVHEAPGMGLGTPEELRPGDVVTVEPGVYRKGFGGVRLEDLVLVTEDGHEVLTDFPYDLEVQPER
jgi:Xaa-Pro aminopeptidase